MKLPVDYTKLTRAQRAEVRMEYEVRQDGDCFYCHKPLYGPPSKKLLREHQPDWSLFPPGFLSNPVHLQHNHYTGMTEGAVHAFCNAVMWEYEGR